MLFFRGDNKSGFQPTEGGGKLLESVLVVAFLVDVSGQIIATSDDLTPNGDLVREIPLFQGNLGW